MPIEAALIKPVVDALMALFRQGEHVQLQRHAEACGATKVVRKRV